MFNEKLVYNKLMPSRNVIKIDVADSYYHVYARGASRNAIFLDQEDYRYFLSLFARYLSNDEQHDSTGRPYVHLVGQLELLAYCLMQNHFHLLFYQQDEGSISTLMRGIMTSYSRYFNKKYGRTGSLFESRYKSSRISSDEYLLHVSRYIHLNHREWRSWPYSSYLCYAGKNQAPQWLHVGRVTELFASRDKYLEFVADYEDSQRMRDAIKHELANGI